jgi:hypothetical protein
LYWRRYPKDYEINKTIEKSDVSVTLNNVKEYMTNDHKVTQLEFTVKNNRNHPIQFPLSYHFQDSEYNLHNLAGYGASGATSFPTGRETEDEPFDIPSDTEAKIRMEYEGFVDEFDWKLNVAIDNEIKTFSCKASLEK